MEKIILGFVGEIASGKGAACDYFIKQYNAGYYRFSSILRDILNRLHMEQSRDNMQRLSLSIRKLFGEDVFAKVIADEVAADEREIICVDGIRREADMKYLKEIPGFCLVYITADVQIRYNRIINRSENSDDAKKTFAEFQADQQQEAESQITKLKDKAKYIIKNNSTLKEFHAELTKLISAIQNKGRK